MYQVALFTLFGSLIRGIKSLLRWLKSLFSPQVQQTSQNISRRVVTRITTIIQDFPRLKPGARVPQLQVRDPKDTKRHKYPLLNDMYILGRDPRYSNIITPNPIISKQHLSIERKRNLPKNPLILKDMNSKAGVYQGKKKITTIRLKHGVVLTLGRPELADSVTIKYLYPESKYVTVAKYTIICLVLLCVGTWIFSPAVSPLPELSQKPTIVYASNGTSLYRERNILHQEVDSLADFPSFLPQAVIASEDSRYYFHPGVDPIGVARAIVANIRKGGIAEGGSTLTQQVARSLFPYVGRGNSLFRKLKEAIVAVKLEVRYSKDFLLLTYLNKVYLGEGIYGFKDAARVYFDKSPQELKLSESATLVAMLTGPNGFDLCRNQQDDRAYKYLTVRRNRVINRMLAQNKINPNEAREARLSTIQPAASFCQFASQRQAPHFVDEVTEELRTLLTDEIAKEGNLIVETGFETRMQQQAERALKNTLNNEGVTYGFDQGAIVTIDPKTGRILAMVGSSDYDKLNFNLVTQAQRQPGSTFKIFAYIAALKRGASPEKTYACKQLKWDKEDFKPCQYTRKNGLNMYDGMALSENITAVRIAKEAGIKNMIKTAQQMGIKSDLSPVPRLVLGHSEVNLLEMTGAYGVLANEGKIHRPHAIARILDSSSCKDINDLNSCREIYADQQDPQRNKRVLSEKVASQMTELLKGVVQRRDGTGYRANLGLGLAGGKTGTTNGPKDFWFIGYLPGKLVTGVWLGNEDNTKMSPYGTSAIAAKLWREYMSQVVR